MAHEKDKGYAWIVCLTTFLSQFISYGMALAFGVMVPNVRDALGMGTAAAGFTGSLHIAVSSLLAPAVTVLSNNIGYRKVALAGAVLATASLAACGFATSPTSLTLLYGVLSGVGICMISTSSLLCLNTNFEQKRALANGIAFSGTSVGTFLFAPFLTYMLERYGLQEAFFALAAVTLTFLIWGLLLKAPEIENNKENLDSNENDDKSAVLRTNIWQSFDVMKNKIFFVNLVGRVFMNIGRSVPLIYIPTLIISYMGLTAVQAGLAITAFGIFNLFGRILCGITDKFPNQVLKVSAAASLISGLLMGLMPHCKNKYLMYSVCGVYGLMAGVLRTMGPSISALLLGTEMVGLGIGANLFVYGIAFLTGPPIAGLMVDTDQNLPHPFYLSAGSFGISMAIDIITDYLKPQNNIKYEPIK